MTEPRGIRYPFRFSDAGSVRITDGADKIRSNLYALVKTTLKERLIRKNVGTVGYAMVLRNQSIPNSSLILTLIRESIVRHEPRALLLDVRLRFEDAREGQKTFINVDFIFRDTGEAETLVVEV